MSSINYEDKIVKHCREVFKKQYRDYWIDTLGREEKEVKDNYKFVKIHLYPKTINLREELMDRGITPPPKMKIKEPKRPNEDNYKVKDKYKAALTKYYQKKKRYEKLREKNRKEWEKYKSIVYSLIHDDIDD
eukprot:jgi/Orpsp1_1/1185577/evm.model.c7180000094430.1